MHRKLRYKNDTPWNHLKTAIIIYRRIRSKVYVRCVAFERGELEGDFTTYFTIHVCLRKALVLLRPIMGMSKTYRKLRCEVDLGCVAFEPGDLDMDFASYFAVFASPQRGRNHCPVSLKPRNGRMWAQDGPKWPQDGSKLLQDGLQDEL